MEVIERFHSHLQKNQIATVLTLNFGLFFSVCIGVDCVE